MIGLLWLSILWSHVSVTVGHSNDTEPSQIITAKTRYSTLQLHLPQCRRCLKGGRLCHSHKLVQLYHFAEATAGPGFL
jgi:hypothetical protein